MKTNQVINIDALEGIKQLPDSSVDFVFCDYPFKIPKEDGDYVAFIEALSKEVKRVLKPECIFLIVNNPPNIWKTKDAYNDFKHRETVILVKRVALRPAWHFGYQHNVMMTFINGTDPRYKWNGTRKNHDIEMPTDVIQNFQNGFAGKGIGRHNQAMPIALVQQLVEYYSDPGDVVLDPFMGSGTTAIACMRTGRSFVGFEKNPKYYDVIQKRLKAEEEQ